MGKTVGSLKCININGLLNQVIVIQQFIIIVYSEQVFILVEFIIGVYSSFCVYIYSTNNDICIYFMDLKRIHQMCT